MLDRYASASLLSVGECEVGFAKAEDRPTEPSLNINTNAVTKQSKATEEATVDFSQQLAP
jgi:hypothetical protein